MPNTSTSPAETGENLQSTERRKILARIDASNRLQFEELQHTLNNIPYILKNHEISAEVVELLKVFRLDMIDDAVRKESIGPRTIRLLLGMDTQVRQEAWKAFSNSSGEKPGTRAMPLIVKSPDATAHSAKKHDITKGYAIVDQQSLISKNDVLVTQSVSTASSGIIATLAKIFTQAIWMDTGKSMELLDHTELVDAMKSLLKRVRTAIELVLATR